MKHTPSELLKESNKQLTDECKQIYNEINFAEIKSRELNSFIIPILSTCIFTFSFGYLIYCIYSAFFQAPDWWTIGLFSFLTIFFGTVSIVIWCYVLKNCKYGRPWYFVRDGKNDYQIWCFFDGQKYSVQTIVNLTKHKVLYVDKNGVCSVDTDADTASKVTGFYQYIATPDKVYDSRFQSTSMRRNYRLHYKHKKIKNDKIYYYIPAFNNAIFGSRYARCIMLKNNIVKYICVENASGHAQDDGTSISLTKHLYSNVNNNDFVIHIPSYVQEYAKKVKFILPISENICYEH